MAHADVRWFLTLAFGLLASFVVPAAAAQAPRLTVDELIKNGARYQNQVVQLRGQLDNCYGECALCPEGTTTETFDNAICLSLVFGPQVPGDAGLSSRANELMNGTYRFAVVTIEARFTAACISGEGGKLVYSSPNSPTVYEKSTGKQEPICFNPGPPDLSGARVVQVHARKTVLDGLIDPQRIWDELVPAEPSERDAILAEWDRAAGTTYPEVFTVKDKQMAADFAVDGSNYDGLACWCLETSCASRWPTHLVLGMNSPANPFYCWIIKKTPNGWRILPDDPSAF